MVVKNKNPSTFAVRKTGIPASGETLIDILPQGNAREEMKNASRCSSFPDTCRKAFKKAKKSLAKSKKCLPLQSAKQRGDLLRKAKEFLNRLCKIKKTVSQEFLGKKDRETTVKIKHYITN